MSTTTTTRPPTAAHRAPSTDVPAYPPPLEEVSPLGMPRLVGIELRKLVDTRTGKGLIIAIVLITALAMGAIMWVYRDEGASLMILLSTAALPQGVLLPILGVLTAANEWSQRTALITFAQEPRRLRVMAAKTIAAVLLGLGVLALTVPLAIGAHALSATAAGTAVDIPITTALLVNLVTLQVQGVLMGVGLGALLLNVPLGIVAYFLIPVLTQIVFQLTSWLRDHAAWLDLSVATGPLMGDGWLTGQQWAQFGTATAIWVLLPLVVGLWRVAHKEVK